MFSNKSQTNFESGHKQAFLEKAQKTGLRDLFPIFLIVFSALLILLSQAEKLQNYTLVLTALALLSAKNRFLLFPFALFAIFPLILTKLSRYFIFFNLPYIPFLHLLIPLFLLWPFSKQLFPKNSFQLSRLSPALFWQMFLVVTVSVLSLIAYRHTFASSIELPNKNSTLVAILPWLAFINAFLEETAFREILQNSFLKFFSPITAIFLQAVWFGAMHYQSGFPSGLIGMALSGIYGAALGHLRISSKSLSWCILLHFLADLTIVNLLVFV